MINSGKWSGQVKVTENVKYEYEYDLRTKDKIDLATVTNVRLEFWVSADIPADDFDKEFMDSGNFVHSII